MLVTITSISFIAGNKNTDMQRASINQEERAKGLPFSKENLNLNQGNLVIEKIWKPAWILECDASAEALGAVLKRGDIIQSIGARNLSEAEKKFSSTLRELLGVEYGLRCFQETMCGNRVLIRCDNQGAVKVLEGGSQKEQLHAVFLKVIEWARKNRVELRIEWVPRKNNTDADAASRCLILK